MTPLPASDPQSDVFTSFSLAHSTNLPDQLPNTSSPWLPISTSQSSSRIERGENMKRVEKGEYDTFLPMSNLSTRRGIADHGRILFYLT